MRRLALALALAGPAQAGMTIAYAPEINLERLDDELLSRAERSVDLAAYVLTDVPVTHHAPSSLSLARGRVPSSPDPCSASDLDALVAGSGAALWIHGHTHHCCDYRLGDTRVINNSRGYSRENVGRFDPSLVVDIEFSGGPGRKSEDAG